MQINLDGSGGQYGNQGNITGTKTFNQLSSETISLSGEGIGTDPLIWTHNQSGKVLISRFKLQ